MLGTLDNAKKGLVFAIGVLAFVLFPIRFALCCPAMRAVECFAGVFGCRLVWRTFVKSHNNIGADLALDFDGFFGCEEMFCAIEMRFELYSIFLDFDVAYFCFLFFLETKRKNLKSPA